MMRANSKNKMLAYSRTHTETDIPFFETHSKQWRKKDLGNMPSDYT
jgi:hypothetical protein